MHFRGGSKFPFSQALIWPIFRTAMPMNPPHSRSARTRSGLFLPILVVLWLAAVGSGIGALWSYDATAGRAPVPMPTVAANGQLPVVSGHHNLIMVVHPQCSCSRASLSVLDQILASHPGKISACVVFAE